MHRIEPSQDPLYASGGKGCMRYLFCHGGHSRLPLPEEASVEARVLVFNEHGKIILDHSGDEPTSRFCFTDRALTSVDDRQDVFVPARPFVETLLKNVSIPTLLFAEIPRHQVLPDDTEQISQVLYVVLITLGRTNLPQATFQDYEYLKVMLHAFVPHFTVAISRISDAYLPGDARNVCQEVASLMMTSASAAEETTQALRSFLALYAKRYLHETLAEEEILRRCLLHMLKMPFEMESSVRYGLIVN
ncbi:uncharacterized protein BP01DRAFT_359385 [Aspergillus saccharolyticus JOP 1030-1]|uniref:Uncharacterized protein n=1 Tax=Aspergillus saccharolyticus JOP 1030-1 TaxID=1450539 RepID=A0A318Z5V6_9EURO|nr:hypothetical protein BP01DRAFT_359385 [Aspergillus saccharolyticus JOP 1030-1]PYH42496.1 hypothetical protein BP01DRAFT_359385 [Aspergillus saccharolyticus JOP 1030-1]